MPGSQVRISSRLRSASTTLMLIAGLLGAACSQRADDCNYTLTCGGFDAGSGGTGAASSVNTSANGGSNVGGVTSSAGATNTSPCAETCTGNEHCDSTLHACVECGDAGNCSDPERSFCSDLHQCVECVNDADCPPTKAVCDSNRCAGCRSNFDCADRQDATLCKLEATGDAGAEPGACVQCTIDDESTCNGKSCDPALNTCTNVTVGSLLYCETCKADSECQGGVPDDGGAPTARCIPMSLQGTALGGVCLKLLSAKCEAPFSTPLAAASLSGASKTTYCSLTSGTSCEALWDLKASLDCEEDSECGLDRNDGHCGVVGANSGKCTIPCSVTADCPGMLTCPSKFCQ